MLVGALRVRWKPITATPTTQLQPQLHTRVLKRHISSQLATAQACAALLPRHLLRVAGKDASTFLQGLCTNNMHDLHPNHQQKVLYNAMLNVQGQQ